MTITTGSTRTGHLADRERPTRILVDDDQGRLTLRRLRPWHRTLARFRATRLDHELADGARPEASARLAARAMQLTSMQFRRDLAASVQRMLVAAGRPPTILSSQAVTVTPPRIPLCRARISRSAPELAELASQLAGPGPVPVQGVAIVSQLLADGTGPLYHEGCRDDLAAIIERVARALTV
jgi:hypothetical protein